MTERPRLLCVLQLPPPIHGTTIVNELVARSELLAATFSLDVIPLQFATSIEDISRPSLRKLVHAAATAMTLGYRLARRRPDAVYFTPAIAGPALYRDLLYIALMKAFRVRRIYHLHGKGIAGDAAARWKRALFAWVFDDAWVIQLSRALAEDVAGLVPAGHVHFLANGVPDRGSPAPVERAPGPPRILFLSALVEAKGPFVLLEALGTLKARGHELHATFAGAAAPHCVERFDAQVEQLGLAGSVRYVGPRYGDDKDALFRGHDIFVFPTLHEAFGLVLLEAMQHRLPVIATNEGAIPEIVVDGETGYLVEPGDPAAIAQRLQLLLGDPALCERMGSRGRDRYLERFTVTRFENDLLAVLRRCTSTPDGSAA
jgi:glycosyltransferase involved in cell wall biosynthesis